MEATDASRLWCVSSWFRIKITHTHTHDARRRLRQRRWTSGTRLPMTSGARLVLDRCMLFLDGGDAPGDERRTHFVKHLEVHHPRPGINAVLRSDRFGTGHRHGIQNAPAGGPLQITDHRPPLRRHDRGKALRACHAHQHRHDFLRFLLRQLFARSFKRVSAGWIHSKLHLQLAAERARRMRASRAKPSSASTKYGTSGSPCSKIPHRRS